MVLYVFGVLNGGVLCDVMWVIVLCVVEVIVSVMVM